MTRNTKGAQADVEKIFDAGHLNQEKHSLPEQADPVIPTHLVLTLDQLSIYDRNPRKAPNREYGTIVNDIRARKGYEGALAVTRRPGCETCMPRRGGNTCLRALQQLWNETGEQSYYRVNCLFIPWTSEADVLAAHLSENDNRGDMIFIDRANAVRELRLQLEQQYDRTFSQRELSQAMKEIGYAVSHVTVALMEYAVDVLQPLVPLALEAGLGTDRVAGIRKLENTFRKVWEAREADSDQFEQVFATAMKEHDGETWSAEMVRSALEQKTAERLGLPITRLRANLEQIRAGKPALRPPEETEEDGPPEEHREEFTRPGRESGFSERQPPAESAKPEADNAQKRGPGSDQTGESVPDRVANREPANPETEIVALRKRNAQLADAFAVGTVIRASVRRFESGYGFVVDTPYQSLDPGTYPEAERRSIHNDRWAWWLLSTLSEVLADSARIRALPDHLELRKNLERSPDYCREQIRHLATTPNWALLGFEYLLNPGALDDERFELLQALARNCRRLRALSGDLTGKSLWQPPNAGSTRSEP